MFKGLDDEIVGKAIVLHGKQLFIDNYVIESLANAKKVLMPSTAHLPNMERPEEFNQIVDDFLSELSV